MPWEAIVLIPFVDETILFEEEAKYFAVEREMLDADKLRNSTGSNLEYTRDTVDTHDFPLYPLKNFEFGKSNFCKTDKIDYFTEVESAFIADETVVIGDTNFPSLHNLEIEKVMMDTLFKRQVKFKIPKIYIKNRPMNEKKINEFGIDFIKKKRDSVFIGYPFMLEAFPVAVMNYDFTYNIFDAYMNGSSQLDRVETDPDQFFEATKCIQDLLKKKNMSCNFELIAICQIVNSARKNFDL